jgi:hypothetical protein
MEPVPTGSRTSGGPVVYAGRFADRISGPGLPGDCAVLSEWDVLPARLAAFLEGATALIIADVFSFPYEAMTLEQWDVPLIVVLPTGYDADFLETVFGAPLFERLTFFDRVAAPENSSVLGKLRRRYRWAESQHVRVRGEDPEEAVAEVCGLLGAEAAVPQSAHLNKGAHLAQKAVLGPQFEAARGERASDVPFEVLEVGSGTGRWVPSFDPATTRYFGVDNGEGPLAAARADFPEASFDGFASDLLLPHDDERFDLVFCVDVLRGHPLPEKQTLLSEMWRVARPGGRLLFLEEFVSDRSEEGVYPTSINAFVGLLLEATSGQVVLEHMESLRYPREDMTRSAVIAVSRLGVPKKW